MPSDMAQHAAQTFLDWVESTESFTDGSAFDSVSQAFQEWLRDQGGLQMLAESYSLTVETLLTVLSAGDSRLAHLPPASVGDPQAWDYLTAPGFVYECYHYGRRVSCTFEGKLQHVPAAQQPDWRENDAHLELFRGQGGMGRKGG